MILITEGVKQYFIKGSMLGNTSRSNTITQYPTVEGTSFSDHYYREPDLVNFSMQSSNISKSMIYELELGLDSVRVERNLSTREVEELLKRWFNTAARLSITSLRFVFHNQVLQSYSWSDTDLSLFKPSLTFKEARVQTLRVGVIVNPDQYYQAAYGNTISVGGSTAMQSEPNIGSALMAGAVGAGIGAVVGTLIGGPGVGTAVGAVIGGAIGFFGSLLG